MFFYNVVINLQINQTFTYKSPDEISIGKRVIVEFINKKLIAFIWSKVELENINYNISKIKPILYVFDYCLKQDSIDLIKFVSNYYHYPIGKTLFSAIPKALRSLSSIERDNKNNLIILINPDESLFSKQLPIKQQKLFNLLKTTNLTKLQVKNIIGISYNKLINKWLELGIIQIIKETIVPNNIIVSNSVKLNEEQQLIVDKVNSQLNKYVAIILYGITGSGKTEVYLNLIRNVILLGKQVLVLLPEINLTPQLVDRFIKRFPNIKIHVVTSDITDKSRLFSYTDAEQGNGKIIIGTRMAVFTPFKNLGLIIVDEEHDLSFKQNELLRYHARDIAVYRAKYYNIPVILGTATPSLESLYNYKKKKYCLYKLTKRAVNGATLPQINLIDLNQAKLSNGFSSVVVEAIKQRLANGELILVYINRRGYAPIISCYDCGWVCICSNCSSNMVYHNTLKILKCHHCGLNYKLPESCKKCNSSFLQIIGQGTQKVEESLNKMFSNARIMRIDQDTINNKESWNKIYTKIHNSELDILVGTQMLTKSHDFPNLTLVVGLNLDNGLYSYDFRATELLFIQLMQVSGRAGRGIKKGQVLLQTYYPRHELYKFLIQHDFGGFANYLLNERKMLNLPPYVFYILFRASSKDIDTTMSFLNKVFQLMQQNIDESIEVLNPVISVMQKLKNKERGQILILSNNRIILHNTIDIFIPLINKIKIKAGVSWYFDINPFDI